MYRFLSTNLSYDGEVTAAALLVFFKMKSAFYVL